MAILRFNIGDGSDGGSNKFFTDSIENDIRIFDPRDDSGGGWVTGSHDDGRKSSIRLIGDGLQGISARALRWMVD